MSGKYPLLAPREIIAALQKAGFVFRSQRGSHAKYCKDSRSVIIPIHNEIARGTLRSILRQACIELADFLELL
ncbi:toxin HicA [Candidatus Termititenax aidoneus]|uniref:Toxin HicA n=1 Tax=Termititenax aidoneus TaxID=2218524 RepID=A0A388TDK9_TERA1|nr:toxin HicA [Candidatus Termititenax aidoneus]